MEKIFRFLRLKRPGSYVPEDYWEKRHNLFADDRAVANRLDPELDRYAKQKQAFLKFLEDSDFDLNQKDCLEFGSGNGFWAEVVLEAGAASYTGADISPTAVSRCISRQLPRAAFECLDVSTDVYHPSSPIDLAFAIDVTQHVVARPQLARFLKNLESPLKEGGLLIVTSYTGWGDRYADPEESKKLFGIFKLSKLRTVYMWDTETIQEFLPNSRLVEKSRFWDKTIFAFRKVSPVPESVTNG